MGVANMPKNGFDRVKCIDILTDAQMPHFSLWNKAFWHQWLLRDRKWDILAFLHRFGNPGSPNFGTNLRVCVTVELSFAKLALL